MDADLVTMTLRAGAALLAGAVIGIDREIHRKPAGLRTHAMVSLGSALVVLAIVGVGANDDAMSRAIQGIITGIGFIGGGVILQLEAERRIEGLTTAASIWVASGIGIVCGVGLYALAVIGVVATLIVLTAGTWLEDAVKRWFTPPSQVEKPGEADRGGQ